MKSIKNVFEELVSIENLRLAHRAARRGKAHYRDVKWVNAHEDAALLKLQELLVAGKFRTSKYTVATENKGGKERVLHKLPYYQTG